MPDRDQDNRDADDCARDESIRLLRLEQECLKGIEREQEVRLEELRLAKEEMERRLERYLQKVQRARNRQRDCDNRDDGAAN